MLSRVADTIYWMSRYLERAENIARFVEVNWHLTLDMPDQDFQQWMPLVNVTGDYSMFIERYGNATQENVISFLTFDLNYANSIHSCLRAARENARTVREIIPSEMWEQINTFYHLIADAAKHPDPVLSNPYDLCEQVKFRGLLLGGIYTDTMTHDEGWHFFRLGRLLERADKTSRILDVKYFIILPRIKDVGTTYDQIQWAALLRTTSAFQAYRRIYGRITPLHVTEFLLLDHDFPRSVLHCLVNAQQSLHAISGNPVGGFKNLAEKRLGHLCAELSYTRSEEILQKGLHQFIDGLQMEMNEVNMAIFETFSCNVSDSQCGIFNQAQVQA